MMREGRLHLAVMFLVLAAVAVPRHASSQDRSPDPAARPQKVKFTVSRETTFVPGPLNADGTVNYSAAMNEALGKDLKAEDNAAVPLAWFMRGELDQDVAKALGAGPDESRKPLLSIFQWAIAAGRGRAEANEGMIQLEKSLAGPWTAAELPIVEDYFKAMEGPLGEALAATRRPRMHFPLLSSFGGTTLLECRTVCTFGRLREITLCFKSLAMRSAGAKDAGGALSYLAAVHRLARLYAQRGFIWDWIGAQRLDAEADEASIARTMALPPDAVRKHLAELEGMAEFPSAESAVRIGERFSHLERLIAYSQEGVSLRSDPRPKAVALDWDAALRAANEVFDGLAPALSQPTPAMCEAAIAKIEAGLKKELDAAGMADDQALAKTLERLDQMTPAEKAQASRCLAYREILPWFRAGLVSCPAAKGRADARQRMTLLVLALAVHKAERGEYPESLDSLAPGILKKLPGDPFSEKPFIYKRDGKGFILYSVGPNGKDDGGKSAGPRPFRPPAATRPAEDLPDDIVVKFD